MSLIEDMKSNWRVLSGLRRTLKWVDDIQPESRNLVADDFERAADTYRTNVAFRFEGEIVTYGELDARANQVAYWALDEGLRAGDCVALFMENRPDYVAIWSGLAKIGVVTALINSHLTDEALAHCINIAEAKHVICGEEQDEAIRTAIDLLAGEARIWTLHGTADHPVSDLEPVLAAKPSERPDRSNREGLTASDLCLYVYTSGTTGLPKAAKLTHMRTQGMMRSFIAPCRLTERDRMYITLPLYHGTGGLCGIGSSLMTGGTVILRRRFSASQFWQEACDEGATAFAYIGELCRYLLNQPAHPKERAHRIRTGFGNGLRPEIWQEFFDRFAIPHLAEFYGSTEGNVSFVNYDGKIGAVGRIPRFLAGKFDHVRFVKFDLETEEPLRGADGFCIDAEPGEPGEAIGRIGEDARVRFEGYNDEDATKKKLLKDVFEEDDLWYRTGDLLSKDEKGYIYFIDRIGDTFRWKGENVSTTEVAKVLAGYDGIETANVYGVAIPGMDGKAGMAAITASGEIDFAALHDYLRAQLPAYAVPVFLRLQREATTTGTFKYRKVELVREAFNPDEAEDPIWFAHPEEGAYKPLTRDEYDTVIAGGYRF